jgi:hypothetical protein
MLPACRNEIFSKNKKKFCEFRHELRVSFTLSQLNASKKPRGYRFFLKLRFISSFANFLHSTSKRNFAFLARRKNFKKLCFIPQFFEYFPYFLKKTIEKENRNAADIYS